MLYGAPRHPEKNNRTSVVLESTKPKAGLILTGGGARAAYQVGVLKAVRELLKQPERNPFPILCGSSAGAVNAATLAVYADDFDGAVGKLLEVWENFHVHHVYRSDPIGAVDGKPRIRGPDLDSGTFPTER